MSHLVLVTIIVKGYGPLLPSLLIESILSTAFTIGLCLKSRICAIGTFLVFIGFQGFRVYSGWGNLDYFEIISFSILGICSVALALGIWGTVQYWRARAKFEGESQDEGERTPT